MLEERSAGAVLFRDTEAGVRYLILRYTAGHWDFPKGNREQGERPGDTARREIREETGIADVSFVPDFDRLVTYYYRRKGELVHKEVEFFLARTATEAVRISSEHLGYAWLPFNQAQRRLTFENARKVLRQAHRHVARNPVLQRTTPLRALQEQPESGPRLRLRPESEPADGVRRDG